MKIKSFVGGHPIKVYKDCVFDPSIRKYRGGTLVCEIPYSGQMLSAEVFQCDAEPIRFEDADIPTKTVQIFQSVDPIPSTEECDYCIVSALYVAACKSLGLDTSRLLTIGSPVADESDMVIGTIGFNRN